MTKKKLKGRSALGLIAQALIQDHLGPDRKVTDVERFFTALTQALLCGPQDLVQVTGGSGVRPGTRSSVRITSSLQQQTLSVLREPLDLTIAERGRRKLG